MEIKEEWKSIKGFEGLYEVSNLGKVKSLSRIVNRMGIKQPVRERMLSPKLTKVGYLMVGLHKEATEKYFFVHRLVASAFLENPQGFNEVNHKDENKRNNRADNLEWCSHKYNNAYGTRGTRHDMKISKPVCCYTIDGVFVKRYDSITQAGLDLGVLKTSVWAALTGKSKTCKGMIWKYDK